MNGLDNKSMEWGKQSLMINNIALSEILKKGLSKLVIRMLQFILKLT